MSTQQTTSDTFFTATQNTQFPTSSSTKWQDKQQQWDAMRTALEVVGERYTRPEDKEVESILVNALLIRVEGDNAYLTSIGAGIVQTTEYAYVKPAMSGNMDVFTN